MSIFEADDSVKMSAQKKAMCEHRIAKKWSATAKEEYKREYWQYVSDQWFSLHKAIATGKDVEGDDWRIYS